MPYYCWLFFLSYLLCFAGLLVLTLILKMGEPSTAMGLVIAMTAAIFPGYKFATIEGRIPDKKEKRIICGSVALVSNMTAIFSYMLNSAEWEKIKNGPWIMYAILLPLAVLLQYLVTAWMFERYAKKVLEHPAKAKTR